MPRPITATRERILRAAFERFSRYGYRRTSMEDIADEAAVSRAAIYLQFRNKEEIFRTLSEELHQQALTAASAALQADQPLDERLRAAVEAKSLRFVEIAYGSPHGSELLDESNRICGEMPAKAEAVFRERLSRVFRVADRGGEIDLGKAGLSAVDAADLFLRSVAGLKGPGVTTDVYRKRLASLVRVLVAGLGGKPGTVAKRRRERRSAAPRRGAGM